MEFGNVIGGNGEALLNLYQGSDLKKVKLQNYSLVVWRMNQIYWYVQSCAQQCARYCRGHKISMISFLFFKNVSFVIGDKLHETQKVIVSGKFIGFWK